jgi:hypothetical protein
MEYRETKAIDLMKLARTYLAVEGELTRLAHIHDVFENEDDYKKLFGQHRLKASPEAVLLCYKGPISCRRACKRDRRERCDQI